MDFRNTMIIFVLTSVILALLWLKNKLSYWKKNGVTTSSPYILFDIIYVIFRQTSMAELVFHSYRNFKSQGLKYAGIYFFWKPVYVPLDLDVVKSILTNDFQYFTHRGLPYNEKQDPLSAHLFNLSGKKWKLLRQKLSPFFSTAQMKILFGTMVGCTDGLSKVLNRAPKDAVDIQDILARYTIDVIGSCAFGFDCKSLENPDSEFRVKGKRFWHRTLFDNLVFLVISLAPKLWNYVNLKLTPGEVNKFFMRIVRDHVDYRENNNIFRKDLIHVLIQLKNRKKLDDEEKISLKNINEDDNITLGDIAAQVLILFEAGFETTSNTMSFCLYELAKNKKIQEKLREEIRKVLATHNDQLTYEATMNMNYLEQAINETLRKYPTVVTLTRTCIKEYKVPGTGLILTKGVRAMIPVYGIHHDSDYYPDPDKFDPDRFSEHNKKTRPAFSFLPFGEGPRMCIGARFAMMQIKVGLIALLLNYEFSVSEKLREPIEYDPQSFTLSTKGGMWLNFQKISEDTIELFCNKEVN